MKIMKMLWKILLREAKFYWVLFELSAMRVLLYFDANCFAHVKVRTRTAILERIAKLGKPECAKPQQAYQPASTLTAGPE